ncbi:F0F1 ATP synthase subunit B [bacterium]|nr:F0F1 ATP synthase subunit B [bacterium]
MVEINLALLVTQVVTFLIAMVIVWKFFWGPLTKMMQDRTKKISSDIERAEDGRRVVESLEAEYHWSLSEIEEQARKEINEAIRKGNHAKEEILQDARKEAQRELEKARADLTLERAQVINGLRQQVSEISLAALEKVLGQGVGRQIQKNLLDEFITEVEQVEKVK